MPWMQDHRPPGRVPLLQVAEPYAGGEPYVGEPELRRRRRPPPRLAAAASGNNAGAVRASRATTPMGLLWRRGLDLRIGLPLLAGERRRADKEICAATPTDRTRARPPAPSGAFARRGPPTVPSCSGSPRGWRRASSSLPGAARARSWRRRAPPSTRRSGPAPIRERSFSPRKAEGCPAGMRTCVRRPTITAGPTRTLRSSR